MEVLVTGGSGVVGEAALTALVRAGHQVRLLSRGAADAVETWPHGVEARPGDIGDAPSIRGAADGCDAVVHLASIVAETGPHATFQRINIDGTAHVLDEAARGGVRRFVYVSSLGAERGESPYHKSKHEAEKLVHGFAREWVILRPGNVFGSGDEMISLLLRMVRTLPAVPVLGDGAQEFQPIWHEDLGEAILRAVERDDVVGRTLALAGTETTSIDDLLDRFGRLTERSPARLPLPAVLAKLGVRAAEAVGIDMPIDPGQITMLEEGNVIDDARDNALVTVLGVDATPLATALELLADDQPEKTPDEGRGKFRYKAFWADIEGADTSAEELCQLFCERFGEILPLDATSEPGTRARLEEGATITLKLPLRGNIQVRVAETSTRSVLLATLKGHPLAGAVRFRFDEQGGLLRFMIDIWDRAATAVDWLALRMGGAAMQNSAWKSVVERVVELSGGGLDDGVGQAGATLDPIEAQEAERWLVGIMDRVELRERKEELSEK